MKNLLPVLAALFLAPVLLISQDKKDEDAMSALEKVLAKVRRQVAPSVVAIEVDRTKDPDGGAKTGGGGTGRDYYTRPKGPTSGTIMSEDGFILTSYFNVSGEVQRIKVTLHDGSTHDAELLGFDGGKDIAMLKIDAHDLPTLDEAVMDDLKQGDFVAVIGRSPDPSSPTINYGILSAKKRHKNTAVQTDAELNYGNVGGPLVTLKGKLIGVTAHINPKAQWGQSGGVGFATHVESIEDVYEKLKKKSTKIAKTRGPYLGLEAINIPDDMKLEFKGVLIKRVVPESPAEDAGFQEGDMVVKFEGTAVEKVEALTDLLFKRKVGEKVRVSIKRRKNDDSPWKDKLIKVELGEQPK